MEFTINSRKLGKPITFSRPGGGYIYVDLTGTGVQPGTLGHQICRGGKLMGDTIAYHGCDDGDFRTICRNWFNAFLKRHQ